MSGTSLDGLDIALCEFEAGQNNYSFRIIRSQTIEYTTDRREKLNNTKNATALQYFNLHHLFGKYIAKEVNQFLAGVSEKPSAIASHGHTVFHQPASGFSTQIGCGATIAANTGFTTVCDFRSMDVANGGQGAPLVPIGDKFLFGNYDACLNIGGIANISYDNKKGERIAYDVCFANMTLNYLSERLGKPYDEDGKFAFAGKVNMALLARLTQLLHLKEKTSLSREHFEKILLPILLKFDISNEDKLATFCNYIADEIAKALNENDLKNVLITGGGVYNNYLVNDIKQKFKGEVIIPGNEIIQFKEALIFAFLGYLRLEEKTNTLKSVTGAKTDSVGGAVYGPSPVFPEGR